MVKRLPTVSSLLELSSAQVNSIIPEIWAKSDRVAHRGPLPFPLLQCFSHGVPMSMSATVDGLWLSPPITLVLRLLEGGLVGLVSWSRLGGGDVDC